MKVNEIIFVELCELYKDIKQLKMDEIHIKQNRLKKFVLLLVIKNKIQILFSNTKTNRNELNLLQF